MHVKAEPGLYTHTHTKNYIPHTLGYSPPQVDRIWGICGSYYSIPEALFYRITYGRQYIHKQTWNPKRVTVPCPVNMAPHDVHVGSGEGTLHIRVARLMMSPLARSLRVSRPPRFRFDHSRTPNPDLKPLPRIQRKPPLPAREDSGFRL